MTSLGYDRAKPGTQGTVDHASFPEAILGGVLATGLMFVAWSQSGYSHNLSLCYTPIITSFQCPCVTLTPIPGINAWTHLIFYVTILMVVVYVGSLILGHVIHCRGTADPSIVDRLWSIVPALYCIFMYWRSTIDNTETGNKIDTGNQHRLLIVAVLTTLWAIRLTWNFWRKGGYSGGEDYRWLEVQSWMTPFQFEIFNFIFIVIGQLAVLLGICTPVAAVYHSALQGVEAPLNGIDLAAASAFLAHLYGEYKADNEMFEFQTKKYKNKNIKNYIPIQHSEEDDGFIQTGLWSVSRHPNYYCEVIMWWCIYLFSIASTGHIFNLSCVGCVWLTVLFVPPKASLDTTENISSRKYLKYSLYQQNVARFFPWFSSH